MGRLLNDRNTFGSLDDPTGDGAAISELLRPAVAFLAGVVMIVLLWEVMTDLLNRSPQQNAAHEWARPAHAEQSGNEASERAADEVEQRRADQLADSTGNTDWNHIQFRPRA